MEKTTVLLHSFHQIFDDHIPILISLLFRDTCICYYSKFVRTMDFVSRPDWILRGKRIKSSYHQHAIQKRSACSPVSSTAIVLFSFFLNIEKIF